jgi:hypothetical protein
MAWEKESWIMHMLRIMGKEKGSRILLVARLYSNMMNNIIYPKLIKT